MLDDVLGLLEDLGPVAVEAALLLHEGLQVREELVRLALDLARVPHHRTLLLARAGELLGLAELHLEPAGPRGGRRGLREAGREGVDTEQKLGQGEVLRKVPHTTTL